jgi:hypothetical protein
MWKLKREYKKKMDALIDKKIKTYKEKMYPDCQQSESEIEIPESNYKS